MNHIASDMSHGRWTAVSVAAAILAVGTMLACCWRSPVPKAPLPKSARPSAIAALKDLRRTCNNDEVGIFERQTMTAVIEVLSKPGAADTDVAGTILGASVRPAWWYTQPDILELDVLYLESPRRRGLVRFYDEDGSNLHDAPFMPAQGSALSANLAYYNLKCYLDVSGRVVDSSSLTHNDKLEPGTLPRDELIAARIRPLRVRTIESTGKTSEPVKLMLWSD